MSSAFFQWAMSPLSIRDFVAGSAVLVLTTTEVDKTGASYYGEQGLHYLSSKGEGNIVVLSKFDPGDTLVCSKVTCVFDFGPIVWYVYLQARRVQCMR